MAVIPELAFGAPDSSVAVPAPARSSLAPAPAPQRKPMARATRVSLFEREVRVRLAPAGLDILFDAAKVLTEGQTDGGRYFGSTMLTVDLGAVAPRVADECDAACARRVAELAAADDRVRERARRLAVTFATERGGPLDAPAVDLHVHREGRIVHLDLDVEARRKP